MERREVSRDARFDMRMTSATDGGNLHASE